MWFDYIVYMHVWFWVRRVRRVWYKSSLFTRECEKYGLHISWFYSLRIAKDPDYKEQNYTKAPKNKDFWCDISTVEDNLTTTGLKPVIPLVLCGGLFLVGKMWSYFHGSDSANQPTKNNTFITLNRNALKPKSFNYFLSEGSCKTPPEKIYLHNFGRLGKYQIFDGGLVMPSESRGSDQGNPFRTYLDP